MRARKRKPVAVAVPASVTAQKQKLLAVVLFAAALLFCLKAFGGESPEQLAKAAEEAEDAPVSGQLPSEPKHFADRAATDEESPAAASKDTVAAMDAVKGRGVHAGELVTAGAEPAVFIGRRNQRVELSPRSVAEFDGNGSPRLLRGSALVESREESAVRTAGARVDYIGKVLVSYDHAEKSTSAFVLDGEARLVNAHRDDSSVRLERYRGATLVVGEILPQLIRQLDVGAVKSWLKGYAWPEARSHAILKEMPGETQVAEREVPPHLRDTKIEDYFSSIDTADEFHQPDYYEKKFDDPDKVVAEQNSKKGSGKTLSPEEAALISLPKTKIDLGFDLGPEFLTADQKAKEVAKVEPRSVKKRTPASIAPKAVKVRKKAAAPEETGDPDVNLVLERLRRAHGGSSAISRAPSSERAPAAQPEPVVPDPVYDYSQNF